MCDFRVGDAAILIIYMYLLKMEIKSVCTVNSVEFFAKRRLPPEFSQRLLRSVGVGMIARAGHSQRAHRCAVLTWRLCAQCCVVETTLSRLVHIRCSAYAAALRPMLRSPKILVVQSMLSKCMHSRLATGRRARARRVVVPTTTLRSSLEYDEMTTPPWRARCVQRLRGGSEPNALVVKNPGRLEHAVGVYVI